MLRILKIYDMESRELFFEKSIVHLGILIPIFASMS